MASNPNIKASAFPFRPFIPPNSIIEFQYIILTGGFGESPYLKREIGDQFSARAGIVVANSSKHVLHSFLLLQMTSSLIKSPCFITMPTPFSSKAVAVGALMLVIGGGSVTVDRVERPYKTWATDFLNMGKLLVGLVGIFSGTVFGNSSSS